MRRNLVMTAMLTAIAASSVTAQGQPKVTSDRVAKSQPSKYEPANCGIKPNHFKVGSAAGYLKSAIETDVPESKTRILGQGVKVLYEAIQQNGQEKNPAAWYYLGRINLEQGDIYGADSALTRAEQLAPACQKDIAGYRRNAWVSLINAGTKFDKENNPDSAMVMYRQAAVVYHGSPVTYYQIATSLNEKGQTDSAAYYFGKAVEAAQGVTDTAELKYRDRSAFNEAALRLNAKNYPAAVAAFQRYLGWVPNDNEAKRGLAQAYRGAGQTDKAQELDKEVAAAGGPGAGGGGAAGGAGAQDLMGVGVNLYNEKKYADAAAAFEKVATAEPYNRDALFNLSNTYLAMKDGPKLLSSAQRLVAIEPSSQVALKLLGEGYKQSGKVNDAVKTAERVLALPADLKVADFAPTGSGATLQATATGLQPQTASGTAIKPAEMNLTFEFLDPKGTVVTTQEVKVPALAPAATQNVKVDAQGAGITAWRYKVK
ncbi:MAG TPA: tetratricopeptide repeat protein [Gemmatimonadales bacterium]